MHIVNQLRYPDLKYPTNIIEGEPVKEPYPSFALSGCGLSCACMLLERLCGIWIPPEEMVEYSVKCGANEYGTKMLVLGPALARDYGLVYRTSSRNEDFLSCLEEGGMVIFNAGTACQTFCEVGHYLLATEKTERGVTVLDSTWTEDKYAREIAAGRISQEGEVIYTSIDVIAEACVDREPAYYLFFPKTGD